MYIFKSNIYLNYIFKVKYVYFKNQMYDLFISWKLTCQETVSQLTEISGNLNADLEIPLCCVGPFALDFWNIPVNVWSILILVNQKHLMTRVPPGTKL